ncbi:hypothetical protein MRX96_054877 [Rhipicephalus microplus]
MASRKMNINKENCSKVQSLSPRIVSVRSVASRRSLFNGKRLGRSRQSGVKKNETPRCRSAHTHVIVAAAASFSRGRCGPSRGGVRRLAPPPSFLRNNGSFPHSGRHGMEARARLAAQSSVCVPHCLFKKRHSTGGDETADRKPQFSSCGRPEVPHV